MENLPTFPGSVWDLVGGRTVLATTPPRGTDQRARLELAIIRSHCERLWPKALPETLGARVRRIARAFLRIGDLLG